MPQLHSQRSASRNAIEILARLVQISPVRPRDCAPTLVKVFLMQLMIFSHPLPLYVR